MMKSIINSVSLCALTGFFFNPTLLADRIQEEGQRIKWSCTAACIQDISYSLYRPAVKYSAGPKKGIEKTPAYNSSWNEQTVELIKTTVESGYSKSAEASAEKSLEQRCRQKIGQTTSSNEGIGIRGDVLVGSLNGVITASVVAAEFQDSVTCSFARDTLEPFGEPKPELLNGRYRVVGGFENRLPIEAAYGEVFVISDTKIVPEIPDPNRPVITRSGLIVTDVDAGEGTIQLVSPTYIRLIWSIPNVGPYYVVLERAY
jgi:hypothetical protein